MSEGNGAAVKIDTRFRRLEGHEVVFAWDLLFSAIKKSELYKTDAEIVNLLMGCVARGHCWIFKDDGLKAIVVTKVFDSTNTRTLLIEHANSFEGGLEDEGWRLIYGKLLQFAAGERCSVIETFTTHPRLKDLLRSLDFEEMAMFRKEIPWAAAAAQAAM